MENTFKTSWERFGILKKYGRLSIDKELGNTQTQEYSKEETLYLFLIESIVSTLNEFLNEADVYHAEFRFQMWENNTILSYEDYSGGGNRSVPGIFRIQDSDRTALLKASYKELVRFITMWREDSKLVNNHVIRIPEARKLIVKNCTKQ